MKTLGQLFAVTLIIFGLSISTSFAGNILEESSKKSELQVSFLPQNTSQMVVSFEANGEDLKLNLVNPQGKNLHTEAVSGNGVFTKRYDLSELEKGIYSFEVTSGDNTLTKTVILK